MGSESSAGIEIPLGIIVGCFAVYLGVRGFTTRGIILWSRTAETTRLTGRTGRVVGALLLAFGGYLLFGAAYGVRHW